MTDAGEQAALDLLTKGWDGLLAGHGRGLLEAALPEWLLRQRWFGAKTRSIAQVSIVQWVEMPVTAAGPIAAAGSLPQVSSLGDVLLLIELRYMDGTTDRYQVPLAFASGTALAALHATSSSSLVVELTTPTGKAAFHDACAREELRQALLGLIEHEQALPVEDISSASQYVAATLVAAHESRPAHEVLPSETGAIAAAIEAQHSIETADVAPAFVGHMPGAGKDGEIALPIPVRAVSSLHGVRSDAFTLARGSGALAARVSSAEQSNTNIIYGQHMILKLFRRVQPGLNPDVEIGRFLTEVAHFPRIAPFLGELTLDEKDGESTTLAMLQGLVANEGDGWQWTLGELAKFYELAAGTDGLKEVGMAGSFVREGRVPAEIETLAGTYLQAAALLGKRTAEMHLALATPTGDRAFSAEPLAASDLVRDGRRIASQITSALDALQAGRAALTGEAARQAESILNQRNDLLQRAQVVAGADPSGERIRIHGDYHLGQTLRTQSDFVLLDFEGEPARSLEERRAKQSPLKDVAGMLRSFSYAASAGLQACEPGLRETLAPWAQGWESAVCTRFMESYLETAAANTTLLPEPAQAQALLNAYLLEKALYELLYELNNRPAWIGIPLAGILALS